MASKKEDQLIEKFGGFIEKNGGLPRIAGRIFGYLLICDPPEQTAGQVIERLSIAKSSFSTMIRLLLATNLIEETSKPGERARYYKLKEQAYEDMLLKQLQSFSSIRVLFHEAKVLLKNKDSSVKKRVYEIDRLYGFLEEEMPLLIDKWNKKN